MVEGLCPQPLCLKTPMYRERKEAGSHNSPTPGAGLRPRAPWYRVAEGRTGHAPHRPEPALCGPDCPAPAPGALQPSTAAQPGP